MNNTALITGASSGIGADLARYHAAKGGDVVLVARRDQALNALKAELEKKHNIKATVIVADLSKPDTAAKIFAETEKKGLQIDILINNAGFGGHGKFHERDLSKDQAMIQVNVMSLVTLTHLYLPQMLSRNSGKILHVASTVGFMPGPLQAIYFATKAFVVSFSQAIAEELSDTNITSTALCPGAVNTEFVSAGDLEGLAIWDNAATSESVAKYGYEAMLKAKLVAINELGLRIMINWVLPLLPRKAILKIMHNFMKKK